MAIRNIVIPRAINAAVASRVTLRIVGDGSNPLLASDCVGDALPVIVVEFKATDTSISVPIPVKSGFTAIEKRFRATLSDPVPTASLPVAISNTVGYVSASAPRAAFYVEPVFDEPMYA